MVIGSNDKSEVGFCHASNTKSSQVSNKDLVFGRRTTGQRVGSSEQDRYHVVEADEALHGEGVPRVEDDGLKGLVPRGEGPLGTASDKEAKKEDGNGNQERSKEDEGDKRIAFLGIETLGRR